MLPSRKSVLPQNGAARADTLIAAIIEPAKLMSRLGGDSFLNDTFVRSDFLEDAFQRIMYSDDPRNRQMKRRSPISICSQSYDVKARAATLFIEWSASIEATDSDGIYVIAWAAANADEIPGSEDVCLRGSHREVAAWTDNPITDAVDGTGFNSGDTFTLSGSGVIVVNSPGVIAIMATTNKGTFTVLSSRILVREIR